PALHSFPTRRSSDLIGPLIKRYIQSHRDLPKLTNQWNSVVRWEMRSRLFLRSREFWWQEGHTFHASAQEAIDEAAMILDYYRSRSEEHTSELQSLAY